MPTFSRQIESQEIILPQRKHRDLRHPLGNPVPMIMQHPADPIRMVRPHQRREAIFPRQKRLPRPRRIQSQSRHTGIHDLLHDAQGVFRNDVAADHEFQVSGIGARGAAHAVPLDPHDVGPAVVEWEAGDEVGNGSGRVGGGEFIQGGEIAVGYDVAFAGIKYGFEACGGWWPLCSGTVGVVFVLVQDDPGGAFANVGEDGVQLIIFELVAEVDGAPACVCEGGDIGVCVFRDAGGGDAGEGGFSFAAGSEESWGVIFDW